MVFLITPEFPWPWKISQCSIDGVFTCAFPKECFFKEIVGRLTANTFVLVRRVDIIHDWSKLKIKLLPTVKCIYSIYVALFSYL